MKHFIVLGMIFLPTVSHLILYFFKKEKNYLLLMFAGLISMSGILLKFLSALEEELSVFLFLLLCINVYLVYFGIEKGETSRFSIAFKSSAKHIYSIAVFLFLIGFASLIKIIDLPLSGIIYFIIGYFGIQFVFFWKLKLLESPSVWVKESLVQNTSSPENLISSEEQKILALLLEGRSDKEISDLLIRSQPTVKKHLSNLYKKIGVKNRMEAALFYKKNFKKDI